MVKDAQEIERMRAAVLLGASLFDQALEDDSARRERNGSGCRNGVCGAQGRGGGHVVSDHYRLGRAFGPASWPGFHGAIPARGFVVCDFGVILAGYCSDHDPHRVRGSPRQKSAAVIEAVREAQQAAIDAVRPGTKCGEVDGAARKSLQKSGLG